MKVGIMRTGSYSSSQTSGHPWRRGGVVDAWHRWFPASSAVTGDARTLMGVVAILSLVGLWMVYNASFVMAQKQYGDPFFFLKRQTISLGIALVLFAAAARVSMDRLREKTAVMAVTIFALLVAVLLVGNEVNGASRWLRLGPIQAQPSEVAKLFAIFYLAHYIAKCPDRLKRFSGLLPPLGVIGIGMALIVIEDLGAAATLALLTGLLLFLGGAKLRHLAALALPCALLVVVAVKVAPYRMVRLTAFRDPWADPLGSGYQILHSLAALGSGGAFGTGPGEGKEKLFFLPETHTDFIFSVIGEEFGLIGTLAVLALFATLLFCGLRIARNQMDPFRRLLAQGATLMIVLAAMIHMGVATALLPTKGLALPFISYGGSSLAVSWAAIGLLFNISQTED